MTISLLLPNVFFQIDAAFGQPQPARDLVQGQQSAVWGQPAPRRCNRKIVRGAASPAGGFCACAVRRKLAEAERAPTITVRRESMTMSPRKRCFALCQRGTLLHDPQGSMTEIWIVTFELGRPCVGRATTGRASPDS